MRDYIVDLRGMRWEIKGQDKQGETPEVTLFENHNAPTDGASRFNAFKLTLFFSLPNE